MCVPQTSSIRSQCKLGKASIRVLVVDDYEAWRSFFSTALQKKPELEVIGQLSDGLQAVQQAQELQPDLILLDIGLPTLNGIEAARQIRKGSPASKILFVSENRSVDVAKEALSTGAGGYVVKSDAATELLPGVNAVLEGKRFASASLSVLDRRHEAGFYSDDAALLDGFACFMTGALEHGNPVILIATATLRNSLFQRLKADGLDVDATIAQRMCIPLDVADTLETLMVNDLPDPVRFATLAGDLITGAVKAASGDGRHVAACRECAPILLAQGNAQAMIRLEHLWDEFARSYDVDILCGYVTSAFTQYENDTLFQRICAVHSAIHGEEIAH